MSAEDELNLKMYIIFMSPIDAPWKFVLRRHIFQPGKTLIDPEPIRVSCCLEEVRAALPDGLHCLPRQPGDPPALLEVWF